MKKELNMAIGSHVKLPHYHVVGEKTMFYVWINENGKGAASAWVKGRKAFMEWDRLKKAFKKDKKEFIGILKKLHSDNIIT